MDERNTLEACARLRSSREIDIKYMYGLGQHGNLNLINFAHMTNNLAYGAEICMCDSMRVNKYAYFQLSYLYTDKSNTRCVRVVTKRVRIGTPIQFF